MIKGISWKRKRRILSRYWNSGPDATKRLYAFDMVCSMPMRSDDSLLLFVRGWGARLAANRWRDGYQEVGCRSREWLQPHMMVAYSW